MNSSASKRKGIHQTATMFVGSFEAGQALTHANAFGEHTHLPLRSKPPERASICDDPPVTTPFCSMRLRCILCQGH